MIPRTLIRLLLAFALAPLSWSVADSASDAPKGLEGAWQRAGAAQTVMLLVDGYWSVAEFDQSNRKFHRTYGGTVRLEGNRASGRMEFDSAYPERVGETFEVRVQREQEELVVTMPDGQTERWQRVDNGRAPLAGVWRITARKRDDGWAEHPLQARRTLKLLTGSRFQWVAFNRETGEFSGTGGGTYRLADGRYRESIDFFSRDGSRVGAELDFEAELVDGKWHHRGRSSRGDPIDEVWSRLEPEPRG